MLSQPWCDLLFLKTFSQELSPNLAYIVNCLNSPNTMPPGAKNYCSCYQLQGDHISRVFEQVTTIINRKPYVELFPN